MRNRKRSPSDIRSERIVTAGLEHGTEELNRKHHIEWERIDIRGLFRRARVVDQAEIDRLFLKKKISAPQHEAAQSYLAALVRSGAIIRSPSFEESIGGSIKDVEKSISSRIMAVSAARSSLSAAGQKPMMLVDLMVASNRRVRRSELPLVRKGLDLLVRFYGTAQVADPRDL